MLLRGWAWLLVRRRRRGRPRRRWWQVVCRAALMTAVVLVAAYISFPLWAPVGYIRRYIVREMQRQMGGPEVIDVDSKRLRLSWSRGIELQSLMIGAPGEKGGVPMIMIDRMRADLSPFDMFVRRRLAWMSLEKVRLNIRIDKDGNVNVAPLKRLRFDAEPERISVHEAVAVVKSPHIEHPLQLNISDIEFICGRLQWLGRVTMSACLVQSPDSAPVSLHLNLNPGGGASAASATFNFTDVDLAQLSLERLLNLPLKGLKGRCSGSLDLQLNRDLVIDRFSADLKIARLEAQPKKGPKLPVVEHAGLSMQAAYDPITGKLEVQKGKVVLPGIDLHGRATVFAGQAGGSWQAIRSLELVESTIHPTRLAVMLTGKDQTLRKLTVTGPIKLKRLRLRHEGPKLIITGGSADATSARISYGGAVIKPPGRKLSIEFDGTYDRRSRQLAVRDLRVLLGENMISARGLLRNLNGFVARLSKLADPPEPAAVLALLAELELQGRWEVRDAASLLALAPWAKVPPAAVDFRGAATGQWHIRRSSVASVHLSAVIPPEARLAVRGVFVKPHASIMRLDVSGSLDPAEAAIADIEMDLSIGAGQLGVDGGRLSLVGGKDARLEASGTFRARQLHDLLACLPELPQWMPALRGRLDGRWQVGLKPQGRALGLKAVLTGIDLSLRGPKSKPPPDRPGPWPGRITGGMTVDASVARRDGAVDVELTCDAEALEYTGPKGRRTKPAGVAAGVYLAGRLVKEAPAGTRLTIDPRKPCQVVLGGSRLQLSGTVCRTRPPKASHSAGPLGGLGPYRFRIDAVCALDEPLAKLLPEADTLARKYTLSGTVKGDAKVTSDGKSVSVEAHLDATMLSVKNAAGIAKPPALPAEANVSATVSEDLKRLNVESFHLAVGQVDINGSAVVGTAPGKEAAAILAELKEVYVVARTNRADTLDVLLPALKRYVLAGDARVEARWLNAKGGHIPELKFITNGLAGRYRGKDVRIRGQVVLSNVKAKGGKFVFKRAKTDGLAIRIGKNDMHLLADISGLPDKPAGSVHLLGRYLDSRDLAEWLQPAASSDPPGKPLGPPGGLSAEDAKALAGKAEQLIARLRPYLMSADVQARADVEHLVTYDPAVGQSYETRHLSLRASAVRGQCKLSFSTLVNGGTVCGSYDVHFADAAPFVVVHSEVRDVNATKNIQPQLARYFPGNTVYGYFNRTEEVALALRDMLANSIDSRYALSPRGDSRTVTLDGLVEGRAAPKFVTGIFPGLNLTKYRYRKMTGFAEHKTDGGTYNDMVFDGYRYDLYMEGTTDAKNIGRYEVGLILLGTPQSAEWNHKYRQGRIPILKIKARIEGGKMYDEEVSYPWPNQTLFTIFLKNNIFYRIWLQSRRK